MPSKFFVHSETCTCSCGRNAFMKGIIRADSIVWTVLTMPFATPPKFWAGWRFEWNVAGWWRQGSVTRTCRTREEKCRHWRSTYSVPAFTP